MKNGKYTTIQIKSYILMWLKREKHPIPIWNVEAISGIGYTTGTVMSSTIPRSIYSMGISSSPYCCTMFIQCYQMFKLIASMSNHIGNGHHFIVLI